jgi:hypothetical protein
MPICLSLWLAVTRMVIKSSDISPDWLSRNIEIHAPILSQYETANALTRLIVGGAFQQIKLRSME